MLALHACYSSVLALMLTHMDSTTLERRRLMGERDTAIAQRDWATMQALTTRIAALPLRGVRQLSQRDIAKYITRKNAQ